MEKQEVRVIAVVDKDERDALLGYIQTDAPNSFIQATLERFFVEEDAYSMDLLYEELEAAGYQAVAVEIDTFRM